jgi:23S rRNA (guanosine2251-2'-O)-methyltransferase
MEENNNYIYGKNSVVEALKAGTELEKIYIQYGMSDGFLKLVKKMAKKAGTPVVTFDKSKFANLEQQIPEQKPRTQGIIAQKALIEYFAVTDLIKKAFEIEEKPIIVALDGITDPHNLGAIARSAYCAGAAGIIMTEKNSAPVTSVAVNASAGALEHIPIAKTHNLTNAFEELKDKGFWIMGTDMDAEQTIYDEKFEVPVVLVVGSEGKGMRTGVKKNCDILLKIPMRGKLDSLNASVSAGIILFEIVRKRLDINQ